MQNSAVLHHSSWLLIMLYWPFFFSVWAFQESSIHPLTWTSPLSTVCIYISQKESAITHCTLQFSMAFSGKQSLVVPCAALLAIFIAGANGIDIFLEWNVAADNTIKPLSVDQPVCSTSHNFLFQILLVSGSSLKVTLWCLFLQVITINGMFPGPLINSTTNEFVHVNVFNNLDEPLLFTWYTLEDYLICFFIFIQPFSRLLI